MRTTFALAFALACTLATSCTSSGWGSRVHGEGPYTQTERAVGEFDKIELAGGMQLDVIVGGPQNVVIHADENLHEYISTKVEGGTLEIEFTESLSSSNSFRAEISVPRLVGMDISGSSQMNVSGIDSDSFEIDVAGSAKGTFSGQVGALNVDVAGSSQLNFFELQARDVTIDVAGSARLDVNAASTLDVDIAGSGVVTYRGQPAIDLDQAGSAKVRADTGS